MTHGMRFEFRQVDAPTLESTAKEWIEQATANPADVGSIGYRSILDYWKKVIAGEVEAGGRNVTVHGVFRPEDPAKAVALMTVVPARTGSEIGWLKLMEMQVEPNLNLAGSAPNYPELAWIAAVAIIGALGLTFEMYPCTTLKVWCNFPMTKEFLTGISTALFQHDGLSVTGQGNWIVLDRS